MIREARTLSDVEHASAILLRAFNGRENARLGRGYARAMLRIFAEESSRVLLVAGEEGRVTGFAAGEPAALVQERYRAIRPAAARALMARPWLVFGRGIPRMALMRLEGSGHREVPEESWFLALIAVDPEAGGQGIGRQLLRAFEEEGARRGFRLAALQVAADNVAAQALYTRCGWETDGSIRTGRLCYTRPIAPELHLTDVP